jgi:aerobic-type carbon monoxide dehydrogenase small subunit (CoxS/CutS family)
VAVVVALLLVLVLLRAPCGGASRPVREGTTSNGAATVVRVRALDGDHHRARESVATAAAARRVTTVGGGAPTPPSGPSQNHN